jgi:hypothetical protein
MPLSILEVWEALGSEFCLSLASLASSSDDVFGQTRLHFVVFGDTFILP